MGTAGGKRMALVPVTPAFSLFIVHLYGGTSARKPGGLQANTYSLAPYSNNGDQDIWYLGDGWYVFQNLLD